MVENVPEFLSIFCIKKIFFGGKTLSDSDTLPVKTFLNGNPTALPLLPLLPSNIKFIFHKRGERGFSEHATTKPKATSYLLSSAADEGGQGWRGHFGAPAAAVAAAVTTVAPQPPPAAGAAAGPTPSPPAASPVPVLDTSVHSLDASEMSSANTTR